MTGQFGFSYDSLSRRTALNRPNGVNTSYSYDSVSRLLNVLHKAGTVTLDGAGYTYDNAGNRTAKTNYLSSVTENYTYDPTYQLTQVTQGTTTTESYSYDAVGNRLSSLGMSPYAYNSSNELTSTPAASFTYDSNGNTLTKTDSNGTTTYNWDFENRLASVVLPASTGIVTFGYDPFGRRIQKSSSSATTNYLYDGSNTVAEENAAGTLQALYTQSESIDEPLAEVRGGTAGFYEQDGVGSVTSLSDSTTTTPNSYTYGAFGTTSLGGMLENPFKYTGRELDLETGLYYYRERYFDTQSGRFITEDSTRFISDDNFYRYVGNEPTQFLDPFGLQAYVKPYGRTPTAQEMANQAAAQKGSWDWGFLGANLGMHPPMSNKCNLFVYDVLMDSGYALPLLHTSRWGGAMPPTAGDWANANVNIGCWKIVSGPARAGDVIAEAHSGGGRSNSGHVGIVVAPGYTASANAHEAGRVTVNDWGFRPGQHPVIRRCMCCALGK